MALQISWTKRAETKLLSVIEYIEAEWGRKPTVEFVNAVDDVVDLLSLFPEIGYLENKQKGIRSFLISKQTKLFYRVKGHKLILLTFSTQDKIQKRSRNR